MQNGNLNKNKKRVNQYSQAIPLSDVVYSCIASNKLKMSQQVFSFSRRDQIVVIDNK